MLIIYCLMKIEQKLCKAYLSSIQIIEILMILPLYLLNLSLSSFVLLSILFTLSWMDSRLKEVSDRLLILYFISVFFHFIQNSNRIDYRSILFCVILAIFSIVTKGIGLGDIYIFFGLSFIFNYEDFMLIFKYSLWIALVFELIKKTKTSFAFIPYIYSALVLFLILNLY